MGSPSHMLRDEECTHDWIGQLEADRCLRPRGPQRIVESEANLCGMGKHSTSDPHANRRAEIPKAVHHHKGQSRQLSSSPCQNIRRHSIMFLCRL